MRFNVHIPNQFSGILTKEQADQLYAPSGAVGTSGVHTLLGATHSDTTGVAVSGDVLGFDGTYWRPTVVSGGGGGVGPHDLDSATHTNVIGTWTSGQIIIYDGTNFIPGEQTGGVGSSGVWEISGSAEAALDAHKVEWDHNSFITSSGSWEISGSAEAVIDAHKLEWDHDSFITSSGQWSYSGLVDTQATGWTSGQLGRFDGATWVPYNIANDFSATSGSPDGPLTYNVSGFAGFWAHWDETGQFLTADYWPGIYDPKLAYPGSNPNLPGGTPTYGNPGYYNRRNVVNVDPNAAWSGITRFTGTGHVLELDGRASIRLLGNRQQFSDDHDEKVTPTDTYPLEIDCGGAKDNSDILFSVNAITELNDTDVAFIKNVVNGEVSFSSTEQTKQENERTAVIVSSGEVRLEARQLRTAKSARLTVTGNQTGVTKSITITTLADPNA